MRILITGANGFVGAHLLRYFASLNCDVIAVAGKSSKHDYELGHFGKVAHVDLRSFESIQELASVCPRIAKFWDRYVLRGAERRGNPLHFDNKQQRRLLRCARNTCQAIFFVLWTDTS